MNGRTSLFRIRILALAFVVLLSLPLLADAQGISGGGGTDPATNQDLAFPLDVTCAATADETIGSTCDSVSSANAVVPGSIQAGTRMNTQLLDQVLVQDGGSDGVAATTADNTVFMDQGIFVP